MGMAYKTIVILSLSKDLLLFFAFRSGSWRMPGGGALVARRWPSGGYLLN